jgi:hypothetical protein
MTFATQNIELKLKIDELVSKSGEFSIGLLQATSLTVLAGVVTQFETITQMISARQIFWIFLLFCVSLISSLVASTSKFLNKVFDVSALFHAEQNNESAAKSHLNVGQKLRNTLVIATCLAYGASMWGFALFCIFFAIKVFS